MSYIREGVRMDFNVLENNIIDVIKEQQAKLGYMKEVIRLYYPLSSLNNLAGTNMDENEMKDYLRDFSEYTINRLGAVKYSVNKERFCFEIPISGSDYVHLNTSENEFIIRLVDMIKMSQCKMNDIINLFKEYSEEVVINQSDEEDFDYVICFADGTDDYVYCFKDEGCHITYHRFLKKDYEDLFN